MRAYYHRARRPALDRTVALLASYRRKLARYARAIEEAHEENAYVARLLAPYFVLPPALQAYITDAKSER